MKPRVRMHQLPGDIPRREKILLFEKGRGKRARTFRRVLKMRERATLGRQARREIAEQLEE